MDNKSLITDVITAACVLHNFILRHDYVPDTDTATLQHCDTELNRSLSPAARRQELLNMLT